MEYQDTFVLKTKLEHFRHWIEAAIQELPDTMFGGYLWDGDPLPGPYRPQKLKLLAARDTSLGYAVVDLGLLPGEFPQSDSRVPFVAISFRLMTSHKQIAVEARYVTSVGDYYELLRAKLDDAGLIALPKIPAQPTRPNLLKRLFSQSPTSVATTMDLDEAPALASINIPSAAIPEDSQDPTEPLVHVVRSFSIDILPERFGRWLEQNTGISWVDNRPGYGEKYVLKPAQRQIITSGELRYELRNFDDSDTPVYRIPFPDDPPEPVRWVSSPKPSSEYYPPVQEVHTPAEPFSELAISFLLELRGKGVWVTAACHDMRLETYYEELLQTIGKQWPESGLWVQPEDNQPLQEDPIPPPSIDRVPRVPAEFSSKISPEAVNLLLPVRASEFSEWLWWTTHKFTGSAIKAGYGEFQLEHSSPSRVSDQATAVLTIGGKYRHRDPSSTRFGSTETRSQLITFKIKPMNLPVPTVLEVLYPVKWETLIIARCYEPLLNEFYLGLLHEISINWLDVKPAQEDPVTVVVEDAQAQTTHVTPVGSGRKRGGPKGTPTPQRREVVQGWVKAQDAGMIKDIYCNKVGCSPTTLNRWINEYISGKLGDPDEGVMSRL